MQLIPQFDYALTPRGRTQRVIFHLTVAAAVAEETAGRTPINLSMVLDRSGSMGGDKIAHTISAAKLVVDHLGEADRLGVVIYDDVVETLVAPRAVTNKDAIKGRIQDVFARGSTNLSGGYQRGETLVREQFDTTRINRVILMTDGLANAGVTDPKALAEMARQFKTGGVATTTIGFGDDFDESLLKQMADAGGGNFFYIENPDQAPAIFREELGELLTLMGQDVALTIRFAPGVQMTTLLNDYPKETLEAPSPDTGGGAIRLQLGDAFSGEQKVIVAELDLPAVHDAGPMPVASLTLEFRELRPEARAQKLTLDVTRPVVEPAECDNQERAAKVLEDAALLAIAQSQLRAREQAAAGDYHAASQTLLGTMTHLREAGMDDKFEAEIAEMNVQQSQIAAGDFSPKMSKQLTAGAYKRSRRKGDYK